LGKTFTSGTSRDNVRFLDRAKPEYTDEEIADTRSALNVITVFTAYPVFWALNEQQVGTGDPFETRFRLANLFNHLK
jgi:dipeptide/tripeptide permease